VSGAFSCLHMIDAPPPVIIRRNTWQSAWRIATGNALFAAALLGLAFLLGAAALIPQAPRGDPAAYARWLSEAHVRFGAVTNALTTLGLFDLVHSIVFRALAALLGLALIARLADRIAAMRGASHPVPPPDSPARTFDSGEPAEEIARRMRRYRVRSTESYLLAHRFPLAYIAAMAAYAGSLIMLIGMATASLGDWRIDGLSVTPGVPAWIDDAALTFLASEIDSGGEVKFRLLEGESEVAQGIAAPGKPAIQSAAGIYVRDVLPALRVIGEDGEGRALQLQTSAQGEASSELLLIFDANQPDKFFVAPAAKLAVGVSLLESDPAPRYRVSILSSSSAESIADETIVPGQFIEANGYRLAFADESHAAIDVVRAPFQFVVAIGFVVAVAGVGFAALYPARRIWAVPGEGGARLVSDDAEFDLSTLAAGRSER